MVDKIFTVPTYRNKGKKLRRDRWDRKVKDACRQGRSESEHSTREGR